MKLLNKKNIRALIFTMIVFIVFCWALYFWKLWKDEQDNIKIDEYNFTQLEKAKSILENTPTNTKKFYSLREFNEQYKADIQPMKNCYYVSSNNGSEKYIFWFMLESQKYKKVFWTEEYAFPKYNLPTWRNCFWMWWNPECLNYKTFFIETISNPCK